ncbi:hypothetical protein F4776DRAFT_674200 [Hypoxylon sp. NC0597]|nr:hypothetical protein F4776DRAFT_674200 [Hypoxylon sp. NC0597]
MGEGYAHRPARKIKNRANDQAQPDPIEQLIRRQLQRPATNGTQETRAEKLARRRAEKKAAKKMANKKKEQGSVVKDGEDNERERSEEDKKNGENDTEEEVEEDLEGMQKDEHSTPCSLAITSATTNGQEKKAASVTTANGHTKIWNKIELPYSPGRWW